MFHIIIVVGFLEFMLFSKKCVWHSSTMTVCINAQDLYTRGIGFVSRHISTGAMSSCK